MDIYFDDTAYVYDEYDDPHCSGCLKPIEDGSVVQFGEGIWHFECFRCAKCRKLVECYSNLLLLRNGSPICEDCTYNCHACRQVIKDEAIMTGDEAYHADCFRCVQCDNKIEDLIFTATSKGIICTSCHEMRKQLRQKRKEEKLLLQQQQQQSKSDLYSGPHERLYPGYSQTVSSTSLSRESSLESKQRTQRERRGGVFDGDRRIEGLLPQNSHREHTGPSTDSKNSRNYILSPQKLLELNQMLNSAIDGDEIITTRGSSENIPSPPRTRESTSPVSEKTFHSIRSNNDDIDVDTIRLPDAVTALHSNNPTTTHRELENGEYIAQLEGELESTKRRLRELDATFGKIKDISNKAVEEVQSLKEAHTAEVAARQEAESLVTQLKAELLVYQQVSLFGSDEAGRLLEKEMMSLSHSKADLEKTCNDLRNERDALIQEIDHIIMSRLAQENLLDRLYQSWERLLRSVQSDVDTAKSNYSRYVKARDDIIDEMIMLNTKNAQLTSLNNDLSRRVTEREREALAVIAGTSFLSTEADEKADKADANTSTRKHTKGSSSVDLSNDTKVTLERKPSDHQNVRKVAQRDSISKAEPPKKFNFRRHKGGAVFGRRGNGNNKKGAEGAKEAATVGVPYDANTSRACNPINESSGKQKHGHEAKEQDQQTYRTGSGHHFAQTRFLRPTKCEVCHDKMWRVSELKCLECSVVCHYRCMHSVSVTCGAKSTMDSNKTEGVNETNAIFGNDLAAQVRAENGTVPLVVQKCIEAVETRGMDFEGIYRKPGGAGQMRLIQQAFERGEELDLCDEDQWNDICAVTSVLKQYFRDLPNPLFTYEMHATFMDAVVASTDQLGKFHKAIHSLPLENYNTLKYLMHHLDNVQKQHHENLMTTRNLALVFGPTLMRAKDEQQDFVDMNRKIGAIEYILNHVSQLFADPAPEQRNHSSPLPTSNRRDSLANASRSYHRRELSTDDILRAVPPAVPPRENAGYI